MKIEIDQGSGFCFGVTRAINKAEEELARGATLYCLGDIVHNGKELMRYMHEAIVVSEETGRIAVAIRGTFRLRLSAEELESILAQQLIS